MSDYHGPNPVAGLQGRREMVTAPPLCLAGTVAAVILFVIAPLVGHGAPAPERLSDPYGSPEDVRASRIVELGDREGQGWISWPFQIAQLPDGSYVVANWGDHGELVIFDDQGGLRERLRRSGQGPGEFSRIRHLRRQDRHLHVFDNALRRWTVLDENFVPVATTAFPGDPWNVAVLPDGQAVYNMDVPIPGHVGHPYHRSETGGLELESFGRTGDYRFDRSSELTRILSPSSREGYFWSARPSVYEAQRIALDGRVGDVIRRHVEWFPPREDVSLTVTRDRGPEPLIVDLSEDARGRLWVLMWTPTPNWRDRLDRDHPGYRQSSNGDELWIFDGHQDGLWGSTVEVLDPSTGTLLGAGRFEIRLERFLSDGASPIAVSYHEDEDGFPYLALDKLVLGSG